MAVYYNEIDKYAAQWLRNLIETGHIAAGDVDERSIKDVRAGDLVGYTQCHFFAGIGAWSYALRLACWPDDRPVWTGSCPCQPFSAAGKQQGTADERHLWPEWFRLIQERKPPVVFGEQVEAAIRHGWLDLVQADLEGIGYAFAAAGIPAAGFGAPHIRQRLWFVADNAAGIVADAGNGGRQPFTHGAGSDGTGVGARGPRVELGDDRADIGWLAKPDQLQPEQFARPGARPGTTESAGTCGESAGPSATGGMDDAISIGRGAGRHNDAGHDGQQPDAAGDAGGVADTTAGGQREHGSASRQTGHAALSNAVGRPGPTNGHWRDADWLHCRDGKWRPVEPGTFPLAHGAAARVGRLRAYGNAIVPQVAAEFIGAAMDSMSERKAA